MKVLNALIQSYLKIMNSIAISRYTIRLITASISIFLLSCSHSPTTADKNTNTTNLKDLDVVDCLLPGQVRKLGKTTYMTPRRPIRTTAADCRIRGGEYVDYDRADYKTALKVWMEAAQGGDAEAQANVGEIYERGLGGEPNYEAAVIWYKKAAEQGNSRAQFNLGTLYEQGQGVPKNKVIALNWYRKAWGLPEDNLIYQSVATKESEHLKKQLEKQVASKNTQIKSLKKQVKQLKVQPQLASNNNKALKQEITELQVLIKQLETEKNKAQSQFSDLQQIASVNTAKVREPNTVIEPLQKNLKSISEVTLKNMNFGKYHALIIGNQNYQKIDQLDTPHADAKRAKRILENQYGFNVRMLLDVDNATVMKAINDLNNVLNENDNLLIFYAGHGSRIKSDNSNVETGYWLPINAEAPPDDTYWVSNEFVTRHLSRLKAKRIMIIADSCYAGLLSSAPGYLFTGNNAVFSEDYVKYKMPKRSRLLLSSGGDHPVLDNAGNGHSVFAKALLDELENNTGLLTGPGLYLKIKDKISARAKEFGFNQQPEFKAIKGAGHEVGDFFFVHTK